MNAIAILPTSPRTRRARLEDCYAQVAFRCDDLEASARLAELAALQTADDLDAFVLDMSWLILGARSNPGALFAGPWGRLLRYLHARLTLVPDCKLLDRFGSTGFDADDGGNQVQHFWYSVAVTYSWGETLARFGAWYHEWNPLGLFRLLPGTGGGHGTEMDRELSRQGIRLGRDLVAGRVRPSEVADWMRRELSPSAAPAAPQTPQTPETLRRVETCVA